MEMYHNDCTIKNYIAENAICAQEQIYNVYYT